MLQPLGFTRHDADGSVSWQRDDEPYPRFTDRYYASFVEDDNGIRLEFVYNPPRHTAAG